MTITAVTPDLTPAQRLARLTGAATLAAGALLYGNGGSVLATLTPGAAGTVLVSAGAAAPVWTNIYAQANNWLALQSVTVTDVSALVLTQTATNPATASRMLSVNKIMSGAWTSFGQTAFFWITTATAFTSTNEVQAAEYAVRVGHGGGAGSPGTVAVGTAMAGVIQTANGATCTTGYVYRALSNAATNKWSFYGDPGAGSAFFGDTTPSTSTTTGSLIVGGGAGFAGQVTAAQLATSVTTDNSTGTINALANPTGLIRLTGAAPDVRGLANPGTVARRVVLYCVNATTLTHEGGTAAAADRITSDTGANITVAAGKTIELIYDPTSTRWRPVRF